MPLFPSKSSNTYYDPIPQSRKSTDSITRDTEHLEHPEDSGQSQGSPPFNAFHIASSDADSDSDVSAASRLLWNSPLPSSRRNQRRRRRLRRESGCNLLSVKRWLQKLVRHPFFPTRPFSIVCHICCIQRNVAVLTPSLSDNFLAFICSLRTRNDIFFNVYPKSRQSSRALAYLLLYTISIDTPAS